MGQTQTTALLSLSSNFTLNDNVHDNCVHSAQYHMKRKCNILECLL